MPKREDITAQEVRRLLHYNPETGVFTRRVATGGRYGASVGSVAGTINDGGYVLISLRSKQYRAHRLAWLYVTGKWPEREIDHRNTDRSDNCWNNLREVTSSENKQNRICAQRNSKTGLLGASWNEKDQRFTARIKVAGRYLSLGYHDTAELAHAAYVAAKRQYHPACTI